MNVYLHFMQFIFVFTTKLSFIFITVPRYFDGSAVTLGSTNIRICFIKVPEV